MLLLVYTLKKSGMMIPYHHDFVVATTIVGNGLELLGLSLPQCIPTELPFLLIFKV